MKKKFDPKQASTRPGKRQSGPPKLANAPEQRPAAADAQPFEPEEELPGEEPQGEPPAAQEEPAPAAQPEAESEEPAQQDALAALQADNETLRQALCEARARLAAYAAGIDAAMVGDAVTLAAAQAGPDADEAALTEALQTVLGRHPEWRAAKNRRSGGFVLGADPQLAQQREAADAPARHPWNRYRAMQV